MAIGETFLSSLCDNCAGFKKIGCGVRASAHSDKLRWCFYAVAVIIVIQRWQNVERAKIM